jgi:hypothetical protein
MPYNLIHPSLFNPFLLWNDLAAKATEMLASSGQVIGSRVQEITRAGDNPSPRDVREIVQIGSEKVKAATETGLDVATRLQETNYELMARAWQQWFASVGAMTALATSRSFGEALERQNRLYNALNRPILSHDNVSGETAPAVGAASKPARGARRGSSHNAPGALARRSGRARTHSAARH